MRAAGLGNGARWIVRLVCLLALSALACNAPLEPVEPALDATAAPASPTAPPPIPTAASEEQPAPTAEPSPSAEPSPTAEPSATRRSEPTIAATATLQATATRPAPTRTRPPAATNTPASSGPLNFTYHVSWALSPANPRVAIATVTINATGGSGVYRYYRDEIQVTGPVFTYEWAACRDNPGSFRVDSTDGQRKRIDYYEVPPCPPDP